MGFFPYQTEHDHSTTVLPTVQHENSTRMATAGTDGSSSVHGEVPARNDNGANSAQSVIGWTEVAPPLTSTSSDRDVRYAIRSLAAESVNLHKDVVQWIRHVAGCTHGGRREEHWVCPECLNDMTEGYKRVALQNGVLGKYLNSVVQNWSDSPLLCRLSCRIMANVVDRKFIQFERYIHQLTSKLHPSSAAYWKTYGHFISRQLQDCVCGNNN